MNKPTSPESPVKEQPGERNAALGLERAFDHSVDGADSISAPDVAAMVKRLRNHDATAEEAASMIQKPHRSAHE